MKFGPFISACLIYFLIADSVAAQSISLKIDPLGKTQSSFTVENKNGNLVVSQVFIRKCLLKNQILESFTSIKVDSIGGVALGKSMGEIAIVISPVNHWFPWVSSNLDYEKFLIKCSGQTSELAASREVLFLIDNEQNADKIINFIRELIDD
jgi:hypothetical protein